MNAEISFLESGLYARMQSSGKLPISFRGHYGDWERYRGRSDTLYEDQIKDHLKNQRIERSLTQTYKKNTKKTRLPSLRSEITRKNSIKSGIKLDIFAMYNDITDSGSSWGTGSPLPDIQNNEAENTSNDTLIQPPFSISTTIESRFNGISKPVRFINEQDISELYPPRTLHIYVACSNSDLLIERMHLELTVWPYLRHLCCQYSRELIVHDLHTFSDELKTMGRDKYLNEVNRSINLCLNQKSQRIKSIILFGDYFDKKEPPEYLSEIDMKSIKQKMKDDVEEIKNIQEKIQSLKRHQQQMKQNLVRQNSFLDDHLDRDNSNLDQTNRRKLNYENEKINSEITALSQSINLLTYKTNFTLLEQWYRRTSEDQRTFSIQPEREMIKELKSFDIVKIKQGKFQWNNIKNQLCYIISNYASETILQQKTIFQEELDEFQELIKDNECVLITRTFNNIPNNEEVRLLKSKIISQLSEKNQRRFEMKADSCGLLSPKDNWEHMSYLKHLSSNLKEILEENIHNDLRKQEIDFKDKFLQLSIPSITVKNQMLLFSELEIQYKTLNSRSISRKELFPEILESLSKINEELSTSNNPAIVLTGPPLNGKSTVICSFIKHFNENILSSETLFIYRILGCSFQCVTMVGVLKSICLEMIYKAGIDIEVPEDFLSLKTLFYQLTLMINFRVVICLDGFDLLTDVNTNNLSKFDWFPIENEHFSLIISCTEETLAYKSLIDFFTFKKKRFSLTFITELCNETIDYIIESYLNKKSHFYTSEQMENIRKQCLLNRTVEFIRSNLRISQSWTPTSSLPKLGSRLDQNIFFFFGILENIFGEPVIRRLMGYITCFKDGCSLNELLDLMTFDDIIQKYLAETLESKDFRYTYSLLRCVFTEIDEMLEEYLDQSGLLTIKWKNTFYMKCATERYLLQKDKAISYHQIVSQYFMNDSKDQDVIRKINEEETNMSKYSDFLMKQELLYNDIFNSSVNRFNLRKILQLPKHLMFSQNNKLAKIICFFNFYWLQAFVINFGCIKLIEEISFASQTEPEDLEFLVFLPTLELCKSTLTQDPYQLSSQILGRITDIVRNDINSLEPQKYPNLEVLCRSLRHNGWLTTIIPSKSCMKTFEKVDFQTMGFHFGNVTSILLDDDGKNILVAANNGVLYTWDIQKNQIISIISGVGKDIFQMLLGNSKTILITATPEFIEIWDYENKCMKNKIIMLYDMYTMTISADKTIFSAFFYGIFWIASWNIETMELLVSKKVPVNVVGNPDGEIITSEVCSNFLALTAVKYDNKAFLIDIKNGEMNPKILNCKEEGSAITNVAISSRYFVICTKGLSTKDYVSIICYLDLFEQEKFMLIRRITGCFLDSVISLSVNSVGSHAITVNSNKNMNISDISTWNLETEEHKHCAEIPIVFRKSQCMDFSRIFLLNPYSNVVYKANIITSQSKLNEKRRNISLYKYPMNDLYVFIRSDDNTLFEIYNVKGNKGKGRKVGNLSGISGPNDIIIPYKDKLVILSERCYSPIVPDYKEVFQIIKIYDLTKSRVIDKRGDVFIYPSRKNEFLILENDLLMGLSDNRSHLVLWNITSGQIQNRIRRNPNIFSSHQLFNKNRINRLSSKEIGKNLTDIQATSFPSLEQNIHELAIDTILVSGDNSTLVAAYSTGFLCVFSLTDQCHKSNLTGESLLLHLHSAAITYNGEFLVQNNYNEKSSQTFLTLWDTNTGLDENALPIDKNLLSVSIGKYSKYVGFLLENEGGFIWKTSRSDKSVLYPLPGSGNISIKTISSDFKIEFLRNDEVLLVCTGTSFHVWNVYEDHSDVVGSFQPDYAIQSFVVCCDDFLVAFLLKGCSELYSIKIEKKSNEKYIIKNNYLKYFENDGLDPNDEEDEDDI